jgi:hypothetical protein
VLTLSTCPHSSTWRWNFVVNLLPLMTRICSRSRRCTYPKGEIPQWHQENPAARSFSFDISNLRQKRYGRREVHASDGLRTRML